MNHTPCPTCNQLHQKIQIAWIERKYKILGGLQTQEREHKRICPIINSTEYKSLWPTAEIGTDVYPSAHWTRE